MKRKIIKRNRNLILIALLMVIGIGYALISTTLGITALGNFRANSWEVYFDNLVNASTNVENASVEILDDKTTIEFEVNLNKPGQNFIFYTDIVNNGTIDAMLDTLEIEGITDDIKDFISAKVTYYDGIEVAKNHLLKADTTDKLMIVISYRSDINAEDLPQIDGGLDLTLTVDYVQADENAFERKYINLDGPKITFTDSPSTNWTNISNIKFELNDSDPIGSVKYCVASEECTPNVEGTAEDHIFTYYFESSSSPQMVCVSAADIYDNENSDCTGIYYVDVDRPQLTSFDATLDSENLSISVSVTGIDNLSGVSKYYYSKDGGETYISSVNANYTFTSLEEGTYTIVSYVEDVAGNVSDTSSSTIQIVNHNYYAVLYDDGTLVLNSTGNVDDNKTVVNNFGKISYSGYYSPFYNYRSSITTVDIEDTIKPLYVECLFSELSNITEFLHTENLNLSYVTSMKGMFSNTILTTLDLNNWNTSNVTNMENMFSNSIIGTLYVSEWDVSSVINMQNVFYGSDITTLDISKWNVSSVTNMYQMFAQCKSLTTLDLSSWDVSSVTNMAEMFYSFKSLEELDVSKWNVSSVTNMSGMFYNCIKLATLDVSKWNVSNVTNMRSMFNNCRKLTTLDVLL